MSPLVMVSSIFCLWVCDTVSTDRPFPKTIVKDSDWPGGRAAVDYYFIQEDGKMFKCTMNYEPYFYISCVVRPPWRDISSQLRTAFTGRDGNNR